jgi:hypothetical protein
MSHDQEIATLKAEIGSRERQITQLEAEVHELDREVSEFRERYERKVGFAQTRLKAARELLETLQRQNAYNPSPNYVSVWEQYQQKWGNLQPQDDPPPPPKPEPPREPLDLKKLYRNLARKFHPDFGIDAADRERRTRLMALINEAYERGDAESLAQVQDGLLKTDTNPNAAAPDLDQPFIILEVQRLRQLKTSLDEHLVQLKVRQFELLNGTWMQLKLDEKLLKIKGRDLLTEMVADVDREYAEVRTKIDRLQTPDTD